MPKPGQQWEKIDLVCDFGGDIAVAYHVQGLVVHEFYAVARLAQKMLNIGFAKDRPVLPTDQIFCAVKFQQPRSAVGLLHIVAGKRTFDDIEIMWAHIAIVDAM